MTIMLDDFAIDWDGQIYRLVRQENYTKDDGAVGNFLIWETACPDCGGRFLATTPKTFRAPSRRCGVCKSPGRRVRGKKGRKP
jgi:ribosomal protein S27AE